MSLSKIYLTNPKYIILTILVSFLIFTFALWLPNLNLISAVLSTDAQILEKLNFMIGFYLSLTTNFTFLSGTMTIVISLLFGLNFSLLTYYIKQRRVQTNNLKVGASGLGGLVAGLLGIGCAACSSFLLTYVLGLFGLAALLTWLPFGGEELAFIGVLLLIYSIVLLNKKIDQPLVC